MMTPPEKGEKDAGWKVLKVAGKEVTGVEVRKGWATVVLGTKLVAPVVQLAVATGGEKVEKVLAGAKGFEEIKGLRLEMVLPAESGLEILSSMLASFTAFCMALVK